MSTIVTIGTSGEILKASDYTNAGSPTHVRIADGVTSIESWCFYAKNLLSVIIPSSVTTLGDSCFSKTNLTSVTIPNGVTTFAAFCFLGCSSLESVILSDSVISIGNQCFSGCPSLSSIILSNNLQHVHSSAFYNCPNLTYVTYDNNRYTYLGSYSDITTSIKNLLSGNTIDWTVLTYQIIDPPVSDRYVSHKYGTSDVYGTVNSTLASSVYCWATYRANDTAFINNGLDSFVIPTGLDDNGNVKVVPITPEHNDPGIFLEISFEKSIVSGIVIKRRNDKPIELITSYRVKEYDGTSWNLVTPENPYTETSDRFTGTISSDGTSFNRVSRFSTRIKTTKVRIYPTSGETYLSGHFGIEIEDPSVNNFTISSSLLETTSTAAINLICNFALTATDVSDNLILTPPGCGTISNITNGGSGINWTATFTPILYTTNCSLRFSLTSPYNIDETINFSMVHPEYGYENIKSIVMENNTYIHIVELEAFDALGNNVLLGCNTEASSVYRDDVSSKLVDGIKISSYVYASHTNASSYEYLKVILDSPKRIFEVRVYLINTTWNSRHDNAVFKLFDSDDNLVTSFDMPTWSTNNSWLKTEVDDSYTYIYHEVFKIPPPPPVTVIDTSFNHIVIDTSFTDILITLDKPILIDEPIITIDPSYIAYLDGNLVDISGGYMWSGKIYKVSSRYNKVCSLSVKIPDLFGGLINFSNFNVVSNTEIGKIWTLKPFIMELNPIIVLLGDAEIYIEINKSYNEEGANAIDYLNNDLLVTITGSVDTSTLGSYIITYTATNSAGVTSSISRTVNVITG